MGEDSEQTRAAEVGAQEAEAWEKRSAPNAIAYHNAYVEGRWGPFRNAGAMRMITQKASLAGVELPALPVNPKCKACSAFHIKGMCNTGCVNVTDHVAHTQEQYLPLWDWAVRAMPEISAPLAPVT